MKQVYLYITTIRKNTRERNLLTHTYTGNSKYESVDASVFLYLEKNWLVEIEEDDQIRNSTN